MREDRIYDLLIGIQTTNRGLNSPQWWTYQRLRSCFMLSELHRLLCCERSEVSWWILKCTHSVLWHVHCFPTIKCGLNTWIYHTAVFKSFRSCLTPEGHRVSWIISQNMYQTGRCCTAGCPLEDIDVQLESWSIIVRKLWQVNVQLQEDMLLIIEQLRYGEVCGSNWSKCTYDSMLVLSKKKKFNLSTCKSCVQLLHNDLSRVETCYIIYNVKLNIL